MEATPAFVFTSLMRIVDAHPEHFAGIPNHNIFLSITINWEEPVSIHFRKGNDLPLAIRYEIEEIFWIT